MPHSLEWEYNSNLSVPGALARKKLWAKAQGSQRVLYPHPEGLGQLMDFGILILKFYLLWLFLTYTYIHSIRY